MDRLIEELKNNFGYDHFRDGQRTIIEDVMNGRDTLGILPTGTGKSLCYQLPAHLLKGVTVVVSPLISLMVDQVKQLKAQGIKAVTAINSFMDRNERIRVTKNLDRYKLIYVSPEMLQNDDIVDGLKRTGVDLFVIDEAHCISQWGHEFRTDYLKLHLVIEELGDPTVLALSATATPEVQDDILEKLNKPDMNKRIHPMDKTNISFAVKHVTTPESKLIEITQLLERTHVPTMIYFSSRQWAERVATELQTKLNKRIAFYHGGMEQTDRMLVQQQFMNDQLDIICCTSAFGMGVDKKNIRLIIHFHFPPQLESFIQEIGRAGRDGAASASLLLYAPKDHYLPQMLIESELPDVNRLPGILNYVERKRGQNGVLPLDEVIIGDLELSESQWNFIHFQMEQAGMVDNRHIMKPTEDPDFLQKLTMLVQERWTYKQNKLNEMVHWIHETGCRRVSLYQSFQDNTRLPEVPCCDACEFDIDEIEWQEVNRTEIAGGTWEERLASIFGRGVAR
ncbi:ATP-dependent DNA helicase [Halobacillus litoralis]|uniref:RecQ family ATP-dependent DNA helicase n=1 Tax=Halobacillus litoralis TaxID=45668 RepID=UPI001CD4AFF5|nr:ATP-dependent DNA helicase RecQ [Halobacillus litoralis]MCA0970311.1 ATP-dependent DNA helicase [Halobacillus litoralis]